MKSIDKINMFLLQKGISGAKLSAIAGLSNSAYSQWNTGKTVPSKKTLAKVAAALDVNITEIMDDDDLQVPYAYLCLKRYSKTSPRQDTQGLTRAFVIK